MPTIEDLRDILAVRANDAGSADEVFSRAIAAPRRTRRVAPLVAALGIVVLAVAGAALGTLSDRRTPTGGLAGQVARPDGHVAWQFAIGSIDGYTVTRSGSGWISSDRDPAVGGYQQFARIDSSTHNGVSGGYTLEPASIDYPANFLRDISVAVMVGGEPGYFTPGRHVARDGLRDDLYVHPWVAARENNDYWPELRWKNGDGTWNLIMGTFGFDPTTYNYDNDVARSTLFTIAKSVRTGLDQPVDAPFRLRNVASSLVPADFDNVNGVPCIGFVSAADPFEDGLPSDLLTACRLHTADAAHELDRRTGASLSGPDVTARNLPDGTTLAVVLGYDYTDLSVAQRNQLLDDADVSPSLDDPSTWVPLTK